VKLRLRRGEVVRIKTYVGGQWHHADDKVLLLDNLDPQVAADYLLGLARNARRSVAEDAVLPATLARDVIIWPELLEMSRDRELDGEVRQQAMFWLGQIAGQRATEGLVRILDDDDEEIEIREHAIFVLSHRDPEACIPHLTRVARTSRHPQLREQALFWLANIDDPRVLALFEEILLER
jgi:HEAT repeat protein